MDTSCVVLQFLFTGILWQQVFSTCVNLSDGKHATQSSTLDFNGLWSADLALDGNTAFSDLRSHLSCSGTDNAAVSWWQVDLGSLVAINRIDVFGRPTSPPYQLQGFQAFVSTISGERTPSTLVYTNAVNSGQYNTTGGYFMIEINTTLARYVSIKLNISIAGVQTSGNILPLVLCEVQVFFCAKEIPLSSTMITWSSYSSYWGTTWASAVDGDKRQDADTCKCCGLSFRENNPHLQIDLGKRFKLVQITVYGRSDRGGNSPYDTLESLHIYVHNSPTEKGLPVFIENSSLVSTVLSNLVPSKVGQYVTLQLQGNRFLVICEIVVRKATCQAFHYGPYCSLPCGNCKQNEQCDIQTGNCSHCEPGYQLPLCQTGCRLGTYGEDCKYVCGHCKYPDVCDAKTGVCPHGCEKGYKATDICFAECENFTYGYNCAHSCGNCSDRSPCNKSDGRYVSCAPGYQGALCNNTCDDFTYGYNCTQSCGNCSNNDPCNKSDGHCVSCAPGFQGVLCNNTCPDKFYGNCSTQCGHCKDGIACDKVTGHCQNGCESGFKNTALCDQSLEKLVHPDTSSQTTIGVAVGVTAVLVAGVVLTALVLYRRRVQLAKKSSEATCSLNTFDNVEDVPEQSIVYAKPEIKVSVGTQSVEENNEPKKVAVKGLSKDGHEYYNFAPFANGVKVCHFWSYIHEKKADECKMFYEEFKNLKRGMVERHEHALDPVNRGKNRYRDMYAYDATRVVLEIDEEGTTDYINACNINGYERNAKFIASQGPIKDMDVDFWRMVWQQNSTMIVMLTNLYEMGGEKCKKYWPDPDETEMKFGRITIKTETQENYGGFVIRRLVVSRDTKRPRALTQYHFRAWPDKDVPDTTWCLVNFWRRVMSDDTDSFQKRPPIVVHCSAGIGRTGTFIALDNLYNQARAEGCLCPFQVVEALRKQRVNMVQTREQYVYLHEAVADALLIGTHFIMAEQFKDVYTFLAGSDPGSKKSRLELQYELMEKSLNYQRSKIGEEGAYVYSNMLGNTDIEQDADRLKISFWTDHNDINSFVVTKKPTGATQDNFWSLVEQNQIRTFIIASSMDEASDRMSSWLGTGSDTGSFNVNYISKRKMEGFMEKNFSYCRKNKDESNLATVRQFELTTWGHDRAPTDPASVIRLYEGVRSWQPHLKKEEPILIYCRTGSERSGLLFTVLSLLFKLEAENESTKLNILEKVMDVKQRDMAYIPNVEQYKFVHDVIREYLLQEEVSEEQVYVNYQE